jgi:cystathionine beta-lyase
LEAPLRETRDSYVIDFDGLDRCLDAGARLLLLCNPHNPTGRVFSRSELEALGERALQKDLVVLRDEAHQDLVYPGRRHLSLAALSPEIRRRTITFTSPTKAFNLSGVGCAAALFGSASLQQQFNAFPERLRGHVSTLALAALRAAWGDPRSQEWLGRVIGDLTRNRDEVVSCFSRRRLGIRLHPPEGTYLAWCDCRALNLRPSPFTHFLTRARVAFTCGSSFGAGGQGFFRLNFATTPTVLAEVLRRVEESLDV